MDELVKVWESSVRTSHDFLSEQDIRNLAPQVKAALQGVESLVVVYNDNIPAGFMGIQERKIEMLFLSPSCIGHGLGRELLNMAIRTYDAIYVDVNEQNKKPKHFISVRDFRLSVVTRPTNRATRFLCCGCG